MRLNFKCKTNKEYVMINALKVTLPQGTVLTIDRGSTEYTIEGEELSMTWSNCYLWEIGDCYFTDIFTVTMCPYIKGGEDVAREVEKLLAGASMEFELEDDADADYSVDILEWSVS